MLVDQIRIQEKIIGIFERYFSAPKNFSRTIEFFHFLQKNWIKIRIFGKDGYRSKEKNEPNVSTSSPWESSRNYWRKKLFKKNGKKTLLAEFSADFYETSGKRVSSFSRRSPESRKHPFNTSADASGFVAKSDF